MWAFDSRLHCSETGGRYQLVVGLGVGPYLDPIERMFGGAPGGKDCDQDY